MSEEQPQTRRQVLATVAELGYEPNSAARSLKRRRISSIGLIVPDLGALSGCLEDDNEATGSGLRA